MSNLQINSTTKTPRTDAIEMAVPENAEICEHWHEMQQHAHGLELELNAMREERDAALAAREEMRRCMDAVNRECSLQIRERREIEKQKAGLLKALIQNKCLPDGYEVVSEQEPTGEVNFLWSNKSGKEGWLQPSWVAAADSAWKHAPLQ